MSSSLTLATFQVLSSHRVIILKSEIHKVFPSLKIFSLYKCGNKLQEVLPTYLVNGKARNQIQWTGFTSHPLPLYHNIISQVSRVNRLGGFSNNIILNNLILLQWNSSKNNVFLFFRMARGFIIYLTNCLSHISEM